MCSGAVHFISEVLSFILSYICAFLIEELVVVATMGVE